MKKEKLPIHVAIIMDGNGRWAKQRNKSRVFGHREGIKVVKNVIDYSVKRGIKYLTLYTFSSENWHRPEREVNALMGFLKRYLKKEVGWLIELGIKVNVIGDVSKLPESVRKVVIDAENKTDNCRNMTLNLALSYGGRDEILRAVRRMVGDIKSKTNGADIIDEKFFSSYLDTANQPDPDLLIRTSGEYRISNFLLWQTAYTEFYFTETLWPDFTVDEYELALQDFMRRERRFGKV